MHKQTFILPDELVKKLDKFAVERNIRTRNQALTTFLAEKFENQLDKYEERLDRIETLLKELLNDGKEGRNDK